MNDLKTAAFSQLVATPLPKLVAYASELGSRLEVVESLIAFKAQQETENRRKAQSARRQRERQPHTLRVAR